MFGKWPTRIFVSAKQKFAAANQSESDHTSLDIFTARSSMLSLHLRTNQAPKETQLTLSHRSGDEDPAVRVIAIKVFRKLLVNDHAAVIARGGSVHEVQDAITCSQREADMRSGKESISLA